MRRGLGALILAAAMGAGCSTRFELPQQTPVTVIPGLDTYIVQYLWSGFEGAEDILLSSGQLVYVAEVDPGLPGRLRVRQYFRKRPVATPTGVELAGPVRPVRLAEASGGEIVVLDEGPPARAWRFPRDTSAPVSSFTDPRWVAAVNDTSRPDSRTERVTNSRVLLRGLAVDAGDNVYVSWIDSTTHFDRDLIDTTGTDTTTTLVVSQAIFKYSIDGVPIETIVPEGTGRGFVDGPGGLAIRSDELLFADVYKNWIQIVDATVPASSRSVIDGSGSGDEGALLAPLDVSADEDGAIYVTDTGNARLLKYDAAGGFDQRIDLPLATFDPNMPLALEEPIAVTGNTSLVYVLDRGLGMIIVFELPDEFEGDE